MKYKLRHSSFLPLWSKWEANFLFDKHDQQGQNWQWILKYSSWQNMSNNDIFSSRWILCSKFNETMLSSSFAFIFPNEITLLIQQDKQRTNFQMSSVENSFHQCAVSLLTLTFDNRFAHLFCHDHRWFLHISGAITKILFLLVYSFPKV